MPDIINDNNWVNKFDLGISSWNELRVNCRSGILYYCYCMKGDFSSGKLVFCEISGSFF